MPARKRGAASKLKEPPTKRAAAATAGKTPQDERRRSGRISGAVNKSRYFEEDTDQEEEEVPPKKSGTAKNQTSRKAHDKTPKKGRKSAAKAEESEAEYEENAQEEDDSGAEELGDSNGEESDAQVKVIKLAPLRPEGSTPYSDDTVHKNTCLFLKDLKANNKRAWLKANDREYRRALKDWESFVVRLTEKLGEVDYTIPDLPPKHVIFRIYRDTRFSKDPTPYKVLLFCPGHRFGAGMTSRWVVY
jgi:hypothetical protein